MADNILRDQHDQNRDDGRTDGMPRRRFLDCMAWVGTGLIWTLTGGVPSSAILGQAAAGQPGAGTPAPGEFRFVQISDTHVGFKGEANPDVLGTLQLAIDKINALHPARPFCCTPATSPIGQKPGAFDTLAEALKSVKASQVFYVPGEHDVFADGGQEFLTRYGKGTTANRWQSFDYQGLHFIGLVNVLNFKAAGLGSLGPEQLKWLNKDVERLSSSTPLVVFTHIPLWAVYPTWGWVTEDGE